MVKPDMPIIFLSGATPWHVHLEPVYPFAHRFCCVIFYPIHLIDRQLRPKHWHCTIRFIVEEKDGERTFRREREPSYPRNEE